MNIVDAINENESMKVPKRYKLESESLKLALILGIDKNC